MRFPAMGTSNFDQMVFSGGGTRCFWHGGWMKVVTGRRQLDPARVIGVSGGALSAAAWLGDVEARLRDTMIDTFSAVDRNVTWHDIDGDDGLTPHQRVYTEVIETVLDAQTQSRIADGPEFQVLLARPKGEGAIAQMHALLAGSAYEIEKRLVDRPDPRWSAAVGLREYRADARAAARQGTLQKLILAAATIPPIFRMPEWDGEPVADGGMVNQAPMPDPDKGTTLVLLTRNYRKMPEDGNTYVTPSEPVLDGKIDFTDPRKLREAWDLGEKDGRRFCDETSPQ